MKASAVKALKKIALKDRERAISAIKAFFGTLNRPPEENK